MPFATVWLLFLRNAGNGARGGAPERCRGRREPSARKPPPRWLPTYASKKSRILSLFLSLVLFAGLLPAAASAQYGPDRKYLGAHVGLSGVGSTAAIGVNGEVAYNENITIGGWFDTWSYGESFAYTGGGGSWDVRYVAVAATGAYHFPIESNPKVDPFLEVAVGYYIVSTSSSVAGFDYTGSANRLFVGGYGGARYFFKPNVAGVARVGFGSTYLTLGVDFRM